MLAHQWPGNVRELENAVERAVTLAQGSTVIRDDLPPELLGAAGISRPGELLLPPEGMQLEATLEDIERSFIRQALERAKGVRTHAAAHLGLTFRSFRYRLQKLGMAGGDTGAGEGEGEGEGDDLRTRR
jgi:two-component system response regulator PilR (NtrC family)